MDFEPGRWERIRENARKWWDGTLGRPFVQVVARGADPGRPEPRLPVENLARYDLDTPVEDILDAYDYRLCSQRYPGDAFPRMPLNFGPGIMAAFLGAQVKRTKGTRTVWFDPPDPPPRCAADLHFEYDPENVWLRRVKEIAGAAVERWQGRVLIEMTDLGGGLDILASFLTTEGVLTALLMEPEAVERLVWEVHDLWFRYYEEIDAVLRPVNPGYTDWSGNFAEGPTYMLQCDICYNMGPAHFDAHARPELAAAAQRLAYPFYHLDGAGQLPHLESLLSIEPMRGIQYVPGPTDPPLAEYPDLHRRIVAAGKKIQLLKKGYPLDTLTKVAEQTGDPGAIIITGAVKPEDADALDDLLREVGAD